MSKVDERIVEMKFENQQFEKNVDTSISTLERLKAALNFGGAEKSIAEVEKSVNGVDFSRLSSNIDALSARFSNWGIVGMTVIQDLTHAAENLGKSLLNNTLGQIKSGGWSRSTNIDQAKFKLEGLQVTWNDIVDDIDFGVDQTAYGLDAAATAAAQLVASGVEYGKTFGAKGNSPMAHALKGISGVASMTSSSYEEISSIFTTVAGQGKLMTMQLRQLEARGLNAAATLGKQMGKTEAEIRDMVTKGNISFQEFSDAMYDAFGEQAGKANETFEGALSNMKSALSRIGQNFATPIRKHMTDIFNTVRPLINELNKVRLTQLYADFEDFADKAAGFVQNVLKNIDLSFVDDLVEKIHIAYQWFDAIMTEINPLWKGVEEGEEKAAEQIVENTKAMLDYEAVVQRVRNGEYGNGQERYDRLEKEGYNWKIVQNMVNEAEGSSKRYEVTEEELAAATSATTNEVKKQIAAESEGRKVSRKAYEEYMQQQQRKAGVESKGRKASRAAYEEYAEQQRQITKNNERMRNMHDVIEELKSKLTPVAQGIASAFSIVANTFNAVVQGAIDPAIRIFSSIGNIILDVLGFLGLGVTSLEETADATDAYGKIQDSVNAVLSTFADILETVETVVHELTSGKSIGDVLKSLFGDDKDLQDAEGTAETVGGTVAKIGEFAKLVGSYLFGEGTITFGNLLSKVTDLFPILARAIPLVMTGLGGLKAFRALRGLAGPLDVLKEAPRYLRSIIRVNNADAIFTIAKAIGVLSLAFYGLAQLSWDQVAKGAVAIVAITAALGGLWFIINKFGRNNDSVMSLFGADGYFESMANNQNATAILKVAGAFAVLALSLIGLAQLSWEDLAKAGIALVAISGAIAFLMKVFQGSGSKYNVVRSPFEMFLNNISVSVKNFLKKIGTTAMIAAVAAVVLAIGHVVVQLSKIPFLDALKAVGIMGLLFIELYALVADLVDLSKHAKGGAASIALLMGTLALVISSLGKTMQKLSGIDLVDGLKGVALLGLIMGELYLLMSGLTSLTSDTYGGGNVGLALLMATMSMVIKSLGETMKELSGISWNDGIRGLTFMGAMMAELYLVIKGLTKSAGAAKDGGTVGVAILMGTLSLVIKSIGNTMKDLSAISWDDGVRGVTLMAFLLGELFLTIAGLSEVAGDKTGGKLGISILMGVLAHVAKTMSDAIKVLSEVSWDDGVKALWLMAFMLGEMFVAVAGMDTIAGQRSGGLVRIAALLLGLGAAVKLMASSIAELANLEGKNLSAALGAITWLTVLVAALTLVAGNAKTGQASLKTIIPVIALLAGLTGALYIIGNIPNENLSGAVRALVKVVLSLSVALAAMSKLNGGNIKIAPILGLIGTIAVVVGAMCLLATINPENLAEVGNSLSKVFLSVSAMIAATSLIGRGATRTPDVSSILASIAGVAVVIAEVAGALSLMSLLPEDNISKLPTIANSLKEVMKGVALVAGAFAIAEIADIANGKDDSGLGAMGEMGEDALHDVAKLKTAGKIGKILLVVGGIMALLTAVDAILGDEAFKDAEGNGQSLLQELADIIGKWEAPLAGVGKAIGGLLGGLAKGIVEGFTGKSPEELVDSFIDSIKNFPDTLGKWIDGLSTVANDLKTKSEDGTFGDLDLNGVTSFMDTMLKIADDILKISIDFWQMQNNFGVAYGKSAGLISSGADITIANEDLGFLFTSWAKALTDFNKALDLEGFDENSTNANIGAASSILSSFSTLLSNVREIGSGDNFTAITNSIETLPQFASALVRYSWAIMFLNKGAIESTASAVSLVNALAGKGVENGVTNMSVDSGLLGWANKNQTALQQYANDLEPFAEGLIAYAKAIKGMEDYESAVTGTQVAIRIINALAGTGIELGLKMYINNGSGVFKHVELLNNYSSQLMGFAQGLVAYSWVIAFMNANAVTRTKEAVEIVNDLASAAPDTDYSKGFFGFVSGNKLEDMGDNLGIFATGLKRFSEDIAGFKEENVVGVSDSIRGIIEAIALIEGQFATSTERGSLEGGLSALSDKIAEVNSYFAEGKMAIALEELKENLKEFGRETGESIVGGILEGLSEGGEGDTQSSKVSSTLVQNLFGNATSFTGDLDTVKSRGLALVNAFIGGASEGISGDGFNAFKDTLTENLTSTLVITEENGGQFRVAGISLMLNLAAGISGGAWSLRTAASVVVATAIAAIRNKYTNFKQAGSYLMDGLAAGIRSGSSKVITAIQEEAEKHIAAAKEAYDQNSPSKIFAQIGEYNMYGLADGFRDGLPSVIQAVNSTSSEIKNTYEDELAKVGDSLVAAYMYINQVVQDSMDTNPVITPVLDMSMLQNGINSANGLWGLNAAGSLNYAQNMFPGSYMYASNVSQDMTRAQIVGAINGMRSDIKTLGEEMSNMQMVLDSGTLVGQLTPGTDKALGDIQKYKERWA